MHKYVILLVVICGIHCNDVSTQDDGYSTDVSKTGINKNEVGANGSAEKSNNLSNEFENSVLGYLLRWNRYLREPEILPKSISRKIRHSQEPLVPTNQRRLSDLPIFQPDLNVLDKSIPQMLRSIGTSSPYSKNSSPSSRKPSIMLPSSSLLRKSFDYLQNHSNDRILESIVNSQVLQVHGDLKEKDEETYDEEDAELYHEIKTYPARAFVINIYNRDGTLKSSMTHFETNLPNPVTNLANSRNEAYGTSLEYMINRMDFGGKHLRRALPSMKYPFSYNLGLESGSNFKSYPSTTLNDNHNRFNSSGPVGFKTVSSGVEYEEYTGTAEGKPEIKKNVFEAGDPSKDRSDFKLLDIQRENTNEDHFSSIKRVFERSAGNNEFDESKKQRSSISKTYETNHTLLAVKRIERKDYFRNRRDTTSVILKNNEGDRVTIALEPSFDPIAEDMKIRGSDLILRKGGVAIAGPGGAATAYTGGTAIVGPYGTVYKSPQGTAILGPFGKIINITDDTDFEDIIKMHRGPQSGYHGLQQTRSKTPLNGFRNFKNLFSYITNRPIQVYEMPRRKNLDKMEQSVNYPKFNRDVSFDPVKEKRRNETLLIFQPKSKAEAGKNGVAVSAPISHAILFPGHKTHIYFQPEAVANAGPSGFAHAHSDLFLSYVSDNTTSFRPKISH